MRRSKWGYVLWNRNNVHGHSEWNENRYERKHNKIKWNGSNY